MTLLRGQMPKLPNVTNANIATAIEHVYDLTEEMNDLAERIEKGYSDSIDNPSSAVRALTGVIRNAAALQSALMLRAAMDEQRREVEALVRAQQAKQAAAG